MNPTSNNVTASLPVQAAAPRSRDNAGTDTGFQQTLTRELAQNAPANAQTRADATPAEPAAPDDGSPPASKPDNDKKSATDKHDAPSATTPATDASATQATPPDAMLALGLPLPPTLPVASAVAAKPAGTSARPVRATTLASADSTRVSTTSGSITEPAAKTIAPVAGLASGSATQASHTSTDKLATAPGNAPAATQTAELQAKPAAASLPASDGLAAQLAAARQIDTLKNDASNPAFNALSAAAAMQPAQFDKIAAAATPQLAPPVGSNGWDQALGERIVWMASAQQQSATLTLNPPNLGPLQVNLDVSSSQVNASFFAAQPEVRHALEAAMPKLREMMNDAGMQLGQATVSADLPRHNDSAERQARWQPQAGNSAAANVAPIAAQSVPLMRSGRGLVDTFA